MYKRKHILVFFILLCCVRVIFAQNKRIDSLEKVLHNHAECDTAKALLLANISYKYLTLDYEKSKAYAEQLIDLAEKIQYPKGIIIGYSRLASYYQMSGDISKSREHYTKSLELAKQYDLKGRVSAALCNIGVLYQQEGNYAKAIDLYYQSLDINKELGDSVGIAHCLIYIGAIHEYNNDTLMALDCYQKALQLFQNANYKLLMNYCYVYIGNIFLAQKKYEDAEHYYTVAHTLAIELEQVEAKLISERSLGEVKIQKGEYHAALKYLQEALTTSEISVSESNKSWIFYHLGMVYKKLNNFDEADEYASAALKIAEDIGELEIQAKSMLLLANIAAAKGQFANAYATHVLYKELNDSLINENKMKKFSNLTCQHKYEEEE